MRKYFFRSCLVFALGCGVLALGGNTKGAPDRTQVQQRMSALAVPFEANTGQEDRRVAFRAPSLGGTLFVTRTGVLVYSFPGRPVAGKGERGPGWVLTESLVNAHPVVRGETPSATHVSRFIGSDPTSWRSSVPTFERVALGEPWPGVEVALAARGNNMEKLFTVAPGADARRIAISLRGARSLELDADGALIAHTGNGPVSFTAPRAWQIIQGERKTVSVAYTLAGNRYGFQLRDYNRAYPVVIDPLLKATYLGGTGIDAANAIALDSSGNVFVAGQTGSAVFPKVLGGAQPAFAGGVGDAFVAKLNNNLTIIIQATYLGGTKFDQANALVVAGGYVYVAGSTQSADFPKVAGGVQAALASSTNAFVAKLDDGLGMLIQATYFGGNFPDLGTAIALDAQGNVFLAGRTTGAFPPVFPSTTGGAQPTFGGGDDAFVAKLKNDLTALFQATYLGGRKHDEASALVVAGSDVFVAGWTDSDNFPVPANGAQNSLAGTFGSDAFVARLDNGLTMLTGATYLGGNGEDEANAIALDANGDVFVAGSTGATDFPGTAGGAQATYGGGCCLFGDAFAAKLNGSLTTLIQATYLGGSAKEEAFAIALDTAGNVFVAGYTASTDFPGTAKGAQAAKAGATDVFVARLDKDLMTITDLTQLTQATYLGGGGDERATGIALDPIYNYVFVAGWTGSADFPGTVGGAQPALAGGSVQDAFVAKLTHGLHDVANSTANNDGDPHITTVNGVHYDFQSAGEFVSLLEPDGLEIQTRQAPIATTFAACVSINTAVAARVGRHRVTYEPNLSGVPDPSGLQLRVDGVLRTLGPVDFGDGGGIATTAAPGGLRIDFPDSGVLLVTPGWWASESKWYLNVDVVRTPDSDGSAPPVFSTAGTAAIAPGTRRIPFERGLLGAVPADSWLPALPDGVSMGPKPNTSHDQYVALYQKFADAWRVNYESSLFDYAPGTSTGTFTMRDWPPENTPCALPNTRPVLPASQFVAQQACQPVTGENTHNNCVFDVMVSGHTGFAETYALSQQVQAAFTPNPLPTPLTVTIRTAETTTTQKLVRLTAVASDPNGLELKYQWRVASGAAAELHGNTPVADFQLAQGAGAYVFEVTVTNSAGLSASATITINYVGR